MKKIPKQKIIEGHKIYDYIGLKGLESFSNMGGFENLEDLPTIIETIPKNSSLLELGSATGRLASKLIKDYDYLGIESNKEYYNQAVKRFGKKYFENIDAFEIGKINKNFDAIIAPWTFFWHFNKKEQEKLLEIIFNKLNKKGTCMIEILDTKGLKVFQKSNVGTLDLNYGGMILRGYPLKSEDYREVGRKVGFKNSKIENYKLSKVNQNRSWIILDK